MPLISSDSFRRRGLSLCGQVILLGGWLIFPASGLVAGQISPGITNVWQFQNLVDHGQRTHWPVRLEGVVCWCDLAQGMIILQDGSGTALIEMDPQSQPLKPGQNIILTGDYAGSRGGATLKVGGLTLDDDCAAGMGEQSQTVTLKAGKYPFSFSWFDGNNLDGLDLFYEGPDVPRQSIPDSVLFHQTAGDESIRWVPGLNYSIYEGRWDGLPDFQRLAPIKTGVTTNLEVADKPHDNYFGLDLNGFLEIQQDGLYRFSIMPQGRDQLFIEHPEWRVVGGPGVPPARQRLPGQLVSEKENQQALWAEVEGTVAFLNKKSRVLELQLNSGDGDIHVKIADGGDGSAALLAGSRVRITGICRGAYKSDGQVMLGTLWTPNLKQVELLEVAPELWTLHPVSAVRDLLVTNFAGGTHPLVHVAGRVEGIKEGPAVVVSDDTGKIVLETTQPLLAEGNYVEALGRWSKAGTNVVLTGAFYREDALLNNPDNPLPLLTTAEQVKRLSREAALHGYPVKIRGIVTWSGGSGFVLQDTTMGIFVEATNPADFGGQHEREYIEIEGATTNQFSPMILAQRIVHLGPGMLPDPVHPTWDQLMDGTLDTQYVEMQGVVTAVENNKITLLTHDGKLQVDLPEMQYEQLKRYANALIRLRGCLWALKDEATHVLVSGEVQIYNASIDMDQAAPRDLFDAPLKHAAELLLFDAKASAFQRVKVTGQIIHEQNQEYYLMDGTSGLRFMTSTTAPLKVGDLVEVVGFPMLGGPSPALREAVVRQTGRAPLPAARQLSENNLLDGAYDSTWVRVKAQLVNLNYDSKDQIFGLQLGSQIFPARLDRKYELGQSIPIGSQLEVTGVYVGQNDDRTIGRNIDSFELLLNSSLDIQVLARPSWWTIKRMLAIVGVLLGILTAAVVWIGLLRRQVEQRTTQLEKEIIARQHTEQQRVVEEERSRIARDLHDDLGSSLTEISLLADAGAGWPPALEKAGKRFQTIGNKARAVVNALDVIVWLVNPSKDVLPILVAYLGSYAEEYLSAAGIACRLKISPDFPALRLTAQVRHNLFLAVKEALHNVVRHSRAGEVNMEITAGEKQLRITITDNGRGFNPVHPTEGNGLLNLQDRLANIGGQCQITSLPGAGTTVALAFPLPAN